MGELVRMKMKVREACRRIHHSDAGRALFYLEKYAQEAASGVETNRIGAYGALDTLKILCREEGIELEHADQLDLLLEDLKA